MLYIAHTTYTVSMVDECLSMQHWWNDTDKGKEVLEDTLPIATLFTVNPR
jgi:hypothetical protein